MEENTKNNVISFDIGIKNMCYCILKPEPFTILDWTIINLMEDAVERKINVIPTCSECNRKSKYKKRNIYYCNQHANKTSWLIPHKQYSKSSLKNKSKTDLLAFCHSKLYFLDTATKEPISSMLKNDMVDSASSYFQDKLLEPVVLPTNSIGGSSSSNINAGNMDLVQIGWNLKKHLDKISDSVLESIGYVIIENQISTIASRMKTIQGMVTQYFIMRCNQPVHIEYISSSNKLKYFHSNKKIKTHSKQQIAEKENTNKEEIIASDNENQIQIVLENTNIPVNTICSPSVAADKQTVNKYKKNKADGILYCNELLNKYDKVKQEWGWVMKLPKKDDYADSFLQGIWYLQNMQCFPIFELKDFTGLTA